MDSAHLIQVHRRSWSFCHLPRPSPFEFYPIVVVELHPVQPCLPASAHTAAKGHCCSDSTKGKQIHPCSWWDVPHFWWYRCAHAQALGTRYFLTTPISRTLWSLLLGSTTRGTLNRVEFLSFEPALIFLFISCTWYIPYISVHIPCIYHKYTCNILGISWCINSI